MRHFAVGALISSSGHRGSVIRRFRRAHAPGGRHHSQAPSVETDAAEPTDATGAARRAPSFVAAVLGETPAHDLTVPLAVAVAVEAQAGISGTVFLYAAILDLPVAALLELRCWTVARAGRAVLAAIADHVAAARGLRAARTVADLPARAGATGVRRPTVVGTASVAPAAGYAATGRAVARTARAGLAAVADVVAATNGQALASHRAALTGRARSARPAAGICPANFPRTVGRTTPARGTGGVTRTILRARVTGLAGIAHAIWTRARGLALPLAADLTGRTRATVVPAGVRTAHVRAATSRTTRAVHAQRAVAGAVRTVFTSFPGRGFADGVATRLCGLALAELADVPAETVRAK